MASPGFFFYTGDWEKKTRVLTLQTKGAWIDMMCQMNDCKPRGRLNWTIEQYARFLSVGPHVAFSIISELESTNVGTVQPSVQGLVFQNETDLCNMRVTVVSRRMLRGEKSKENNRKRQSEYRKKRGSNGDVTDDVTAKYSGSSSSSSISSSDLNLKDSNNNLKEKENSVKEKEVDAFAIEIKAKVIQRINELSGKRFSHEKPKSMLEHLNARIVRDKVPLADLMTVVEFMWSRWKDKDEMIRYFDPVTLFRPKNFARYFQESQQPRLSRQPLPPPDVALKQRQAQKKASGEK